jgi:uncharacterized membrane protein YoaK (UPF0700 family)
MRRLRHLTGQPPHTVHQPAAGAAAGVQCGAINAGGFLVVGLYTSHMTGFVSVIADNLVLGKMALVLGAVGALLASSRGRPPPPCW